MADCVYPALERFDMRGQLGNFWCGPLLAAGGSFRHRVSRHFSYRLLSEDDCWRGEENCVRACDRGLVFPSPCSPHMFTCGASGSQLRPANPVLLYRPGLLPLLLRCRSPQANRHNTVNVMEIHCCPMVFSGFYIH